MITLAEPGPLRARIAADTLGLSPEAWTALTAAASAGRVGRTVPIDTGIAALLELRAAGYIATASPTITLSGLIAESGVRGAAGRAPEVEGDCEGVPHFTIRRTVLGTGADALAEHTIIAHYYDRAGGLHSFERETVTGPAFRMVGDTECIEPTVADDLVARHAGEPYTPSWRGRGWSVELHAGYKLFRVTS